LFFAPGAVIRTCGPVATGGDTGSAPRPSGGSTTATDRPSAVHSSEVTSVASTGAAAARRERPLAASAT
jgi:hypothetical protein